ncbi:branched-chain amino acid ABC transporter permease [soil metagenome]
MTVSSMMRLKRLNRGGLLVLGLILALVGGRIAYVMAVEGFNAAHFVGAFVRSFQLGSLYALIALGYTMVYGIIRLINFAHGEVFMVGAFASFFLFSNTPYALPWAVLAAAVIAYGVMRVLDTFRGRLLDPVVLGGGALVFALSVYALHTVNIHWLLAMLMSMMITAVLGITIDRIAYRPLRGAPRMSLLITAIAVSFFLQNFGILAFTRNQTPYSPATSWTDPLRFEVFGSTVFTSLLIVLVPLVTLVLVVALTLFVSRSRLGKAMRATAQDPETAQMMGVNVNKVIATTFLLGSMLAAAAGVLWGLSFGSLNQPAVFGILPGIKAFAAAVIGGIGSLPGAVLGGLLLGFLENFLTALFPRTATFAGITEYRDTFAFIMLVIILLIKPSGLIGEDLSEKV